MLSTEAFIRLIHLYTPATALLGLSVLKPDKQMSTRWYQQQYISMLVTDIERNPRRNLYIRLTALAEQPASGRGTEADSLGTSVLWVDYDCYANREAGLAQLQKLKPTIIVASGNGLQAYWLLDRFYSTLEELQHVKGANKHLLTQLDPNAADSCFDLARVLRIPGSFNMKQADQPKAVQVVYYDEQARYTLADFEAAALTPVTVPLQWDSSPIPDNFVDAVKRKDKKLYARIASEEGALKNDAPTTGDRVDRSRNDAYICLRLLQLGYDAGVLLSVLMHPTWLSGAKYRDTDRYDYVVTTVHNAIQVYEASEDRYFLDGKFKPDKLSDTLAASTDAPEAVPFIYAGEELRRYEGGVYQPKAEEWVRQQAIAKLGSKWSSFAANELVTYLEHRYVTSIDTLNAHSGLVNVANGMLNVHTGTLEEHNPAYRSLNQIPAVYDPNADCTELDTFVADILPEDTIPVFWQYVGSALLQTHYYPKSFLALIGRKDSGKSQLLKWLYAFYGGADNCSTVSFQSLADNRFSVAKLYGKVANIFSDVSDTEAQSSGQIKALTGDDLLDGERKFKQGFSFVNTARLFFSANQHLSIRGADEAFFGRAIIIRCANRFVAVPDPTKPYEKQAIPFIVDRLTTPKHFSAGLLRATQGLKHLLDTQQYSHSKSIEAAVTEFRFTADTVAGFLGAAQYIPGFVIPKDHMYRMYKLTCELAGKRALAQDNFNRRALEVAEQLGLEEAVRAYQGVKQAVYLHRKPSASFLPKTLVEEARKRLAEEGKL